MKVSRLRYLDEKEGGCLVNGGTHAALICIGVVSSLQEAEVYEDSWCCRHFCPLLPDLDEKTA